MLQIWKNTAANSGCTYQIGKRNLNIEKVVRKLNVSTSQRKELLSFNLMVYSLAVLIISVHPQPIDVSSFYRRELHETMQPRKLKSMWQLLGGCRGGNETGDGESGQKPTKPDCIIHGWSQSILISCSPNPAPNFDTTILNSHASNEQARLVSLFWNLW